MLRKRILFYSSVLLVLLLHLFPACKSQKETGLIDVITTFERERIDSLVQVYKVYEPLTVTSAFCNRSAGTVHDFYSEGDYWWPDPLDPDGAYIRRDGLSNPEIFNEHREALMRFSRVTGAFVSQWLLTGEEEYAVIAWKHIHAWFIDSLTRMDPHMLYAQAIKGRYTGRGIGIIDGLHLIEVAKCVSILEETDLIPEEEMEEAKAWFEDFLQWITTHPYGIAESIHPNNHGTCWHLQAAVYADLTGNDSLVGLCIQRYKEKLLPLQMAEDGSFPLELERTKPFGYSLFNLDAMSLLVHVLSIASGEDLFSFCTPDGKNIRNALRFMEPFIKDKSIWPWEKDVLYWDQWPVSQASLLLQGLAFDDRDYIDCWLKLEHNPELFEIQRNMVMKYPLLWIQTEK